MDHGYCNDAAEAPPVPARPAFLLKPLNEPAERAVDHRRNAHLRACFDNTVGLWVDFSAADRTAYTLGCGDTDIYLPDPRPGRRSSPQIDSLHASFSLVEDTGAVLLRDHSRHRTVQPLPQSPCYTVRFCPNVDSVLVARGINSRVAFGRDGWYEFGLVWHSDGLYHFPNKDEPYTMGPSSDRSKRYLQGDMVGGGAYGTVWWVLDATSGKLMAVKKFHKLTGRNLEFATREVANLFRINKNDSIQHEHILQIFDYAGGGRGDDWGEIFMPLMAGNLKTLVEQRHARNNAGLSDIVLRQMLLALKCIASHKIIHRDVKPENILWEHDENGSYRFCLGDFGLSNDPELARTAAGTEPFMAPEVFHRQRQTTKVDIWSLFATIVWVRSDQFRRECSHYPAHDLHEWLVRFSQMDEYANIRDMANMDPRQRPSAARQLALLDGAGDDDQPDQPEPGSAAAGDDAVTPPELPYYEPYVSGAMEDFAAVDGGGGAQRWAPRSQRYLSPSEGRSHAPRHHGHAFVMPYKNPYAPPANAAEGSGSGSGTEVPDTLTAMAALTLNDNNNNDDNGDYDDYDDHDDDGGWPHEASPGRKRKEKRD